jgi:hypothetical protein
MDLQLSSAIRTSLSHLAVGPVTDALLAMKVR